MDIQTHFYPYKKKNNNTIFLILKHKFLESFQKLTSIKCLFKYSNSQI